MYEILIMNAYTNACYIYFLAGNQDIPSTGNQVSE